MKKSKITLTRETPSHPHALVAAEKQLIKTLDSLLEGVQIIDFNWRYVYINDALTDYKNTTKEHLLGHTLMERYPGVEHTALFAALQQCMTGRQKNKIETEFVYPDQSIKWFELHIEPVEEGILVLSLDITARRESDEKIKKINHLYAFISQVNQNIVRVDDEATLFQNACRMAVRFGKFEVAWIGLFDVENKKISLVDQSGMQPEDVTQFIDVSFDFDGPQDSVLRYNKHYICNDVGHDATGINFRKYATTRGIRSYMVLPIRKSGAIIGTLNLYATAPDFAGPEEIDLMTEVSSDISFALDRFEKEKKHKATEERIVQNEKQFRNAFDHMLEGVQIHDFNWRYVYVNDALVNYSTHAREDLLGFTLMEKYPGIEQTPLFHVLQRCMTLREAQQLETDFIFPNGTTRHFDLSIQPIPEGIFVHSVDRTEQKKANEKLQEVNRLYAFISAINQSIVHIKNERDLLENACDIAVGIGQFKMALIDLVDEQTGKLNRVSIRGPSVAVEEAREHYGIDYNHPLLIKTPTGRALHSGLYAVNNEVQQDPSMELWRKHFIEHDIKATISLPIKKKGTVVGIFALHSTVNHFFNEQEIYLLEEATGDISFALENFDSAERHRVTEELVFKNEIRFRSLIENSADMKTLVTDEGELIYGSPSITKVLGYAVQEILNRRDQQFIHPEDFPAFTQNIARIVETPGGSFSTEQRLLHKNGTWIWCEGTVTNMLHQPGVHAIVSNFRDISEKKIFQQQQEFNKNNLKALINNISDLMWSVDSGFNLITSNQPFDNSIELTRGKPIAKGESILDPGLSKTQSTRFRAIYERAFTGEAFTEIEYTKHPVETWIVISYCPIWRENEVIGAACHSRDISAIKKYELKLKQSESFIGGILNALNSQIAVIDGVGNIVATNESWRRCTDEYGSTILHDAGIGTNYFTVCEASARVGDQTSYDVLSGMRNVMNDDRPIFYFEYMCNSHTLHRWFSMRVTKFDSNEPMIVVAHEDISDRKRAEENLILNNNELQKTNVELDRFVYSASHDLRAPLCSVLGLTSLIEIESKEAGTLNYAKMIRNSVNRLDNFIRNILKYSKNNRLALEVVQIPLRKTIDDILDLLRNVKEAIGIEFEIDVEEPHLFYSDVHRFNIILENLISNAIKFQDHNRARRSIKITARSDEKNLALSIEDNGIGIATEYQTKIYDMFFRISGEREGTGIGLYIVKETITKLQGSINVTSQANVGTTFRIQLRNLIS